AMPPSCECLCARLSYGQQAGRLASPFGAAARSSDRCPTLASAAATFSLLISFVPMRTSTSDCISHSAFLTPLTSSAVDSIRCLQSPQTPKTFSEIVCCLLSTDLPCAATEEENPVKSKITRAIGNIF